MNGLVFWVGYVPANQHYLIQSCTFSNCAATTQTLVDISTDITVYPYPACDTANNEIVWGQQDTSSNFVVIHRASATGTNQRTITQYALPSDGTIWGNVSSFTADKFFYGNYNGTDANPKAKLYSISTSTVNAQGILLATYTGQIFFNGLPGVFAGGSTVLFSGCSGTTCTTPTPTYLTLSAPLPNGTTGTPPKWTDGLIFGGTVDGSTFYGTISNAPNDSPPQDALVKCGVPTCTSPTILARGQGNANYFATDSTAIYYTTSGAAVSTAVWKLAK
jgi:hypothetical protein